MKGMGRDYALGDSHSELQFARVWETMTGGHRRKSNPLSVASSSISLFNTAPACSLFSRISKEKTRRNGLTSYMSHNRSNLTCSRRKSFA